MISLNSHSADHNYTTAPIKSAVSAPTWITVIVTLLSSAACGPGIGTDAGDSFGETTGTGETGGDTTEPLIPGTGLRCVERDAGIVTCWVGWGTAKARVLLPCEAEGPVALGVWTPAYDYVLDGWGPVSCHSLVGSDEPDVCLYSSERVRLTLDSAGAWVPEVSPTVCGLDEVDAPCGASDCPGAAGCACDAGECQAGLVCNFVEVCSTCEAGDPGCPCGPSGGCLVGECYEGVDIDGTAWNICYPADLLGCADGECPGDAYCTDTSQCAWPRD